ncbi:MAG TPA: XdhC family protein [Vicinamibacterales bacterium]|nr:XdhC family protein [Vicinamibacterales bacterium]
MSAMDLFEQIAALRREGQSFALATVVARRAPVSAHLGDRAIVFADGRMQGFVGGACSREIIRQQALDALKTRCSRLVSIQPNASDSGTPTDEHVVVPMTCVSEGAIDVYVEPFVQARRLVVAGATPVAGSLARLARSMDFHVVRVVDGRESHDIEQETATLGVAVVTLDALEAFLREGGLGGAECAAVAVSQGHYDEETLESFLRCGVPYVGLVASRTRGAAVKALLEERGVPGVATIRNPAGLDLGARTPPEVALSILAEIVQARPSGVRVAAATEAAASPTAASPAPATAVDPVCGMSVTIASARHVAEVDGVAYYFCCANCRSKFLKDPQAYPARP